MFKDIEGIVNEVSAEDAHIEDCGCVKLTEEVEALIDSDEPWALTDNVCGPTRNADEVEKSIQEWITKLSDLGYYNEDAERAVFDALAALVENNMLPDAPDYEASLPEKNQWIERFNNAMPTRLIAIGIELNG